MTSLYDSLKNHIVTLAFFQLQEQAFARAVSRSLFIDVKVDYDLKIVTIVKYIAAQNMQDCIELGQLLMKHLAEVLSRKRGKYYGFGEHNEEFYVFNQTPHDDIENIQVNSLDMERRSSDIDNRLKKKNYLDNVSRGVVLKGTSKLFQDGENVEFHSMRSIVKKIKRIKVAWNERQRHLRAQLRVFKLKKLFC